LAATIRLRWYTKSSGILNHMVLDRSPRLDRVFHALAHPARRAIIRQLAGGERNLSELASPLWMTFPAATKHVRVGGQGGQCQVLGRTGSDTVLKGKAPHWDCHIEGPVRFDDAIDQMDEPAHARSDDRLRCHASTL
jgi:hypothetical protein